ncbi:MAG: DUF58 domain-containing protein [Candidatus Marinimicrobia bacterium]|nr:DUF58 domain-containing protein [Candidatus Neomarinimicrobiota bacterium]MCF7828963.1 DUF58 domain-containing protein [Candidatus Neomarinimicrobiota bacterium]MCF7879923.1 DUF58 domain-containing protein [Candidatus Neomarinimicrobiota bacterium]
MISKEVLRKVRRIEIRTRHLVNDVFSGEYHSVFKGRGMEFAEVREYQFGDDIRSIDWNVTARNQRPYVKVFEEERELTVMLLVDASASEAFGSVEQMKIEIAAELAALLSFAAIKNNDKVGLIMFTDQIEKYVPPRKGRTHILRLIREILAFEPESTGTDISRAVEYLLNVQRRRSVAFLISDFWDKGFEQPLRVAGKKHDMIGFWLVDPKEEALPDVGLLRVRDPETGEEMVVDTSDRELRTLFVSAMQNRRESLNKLFTSMSLDTVRINTAESYVEPVMKFFKMRERRMQ